MDEYCRRWSLRTSESAAEACLPRRTNETFKRQEGVEGSERAADALGNVGQLGHEHVSPRPDSPALQAILIVEDTPLIYFTQSFVCTSDRRETWWSDGCTYRITPRHEMGMWLLWLLWCVGERREKISRGDPLEIIV